MNETVAMNRYKDWINARGIDRAIRQELLNLIGTPDEIEDRFYKELDFGTAGMRGLMGGGTNRMNIYSVAAVSYAFARYILAEGKAGATVLVSYDSRNNSREFAEVCAKVMAETGVKVKLFDDIRPVPELAYAVRYYGYDGGVEITASHNGKDYNGFKAYARGGRQLNKDEAAKIREIRNSVESWIELLNDTAGFDEHIATGMIEYVGHEEDELYITNSIRVARSEFVTLKDRNNIRIVYSPLNGAGNNIVRTAFSRLGYENVFVVPEQEYPDGDFSTLKVPNPERQDAYELAIKYARMIAADLIVLTDPDSDRLGIAAKDDYGEYVVLTGNQIGLLLMEYILSYRVRTNNMPEEAFCVTSFVSSRLTESICNRYGVKLYNVFTGSKYIAGVIEEKDIRGTENFVFAFEESHGYIFNGGPLDKDGVTAALMIAEIAAKSKADGRRLYDDLQAIYDSYEYGEESVYSLEFEGESGLFDIKNIMDHYRGLKGYLGVPGSGGSQIKVARYIDFFPEYDMLYYELQDNGWIALRPSGTEPKLKVYFGFYGSRTSVKNNMGNLPSLFIDDINGFRSV